MTSLKTKMTLAVSLLAGVLLTVTAGACFLYFSGQLKESISRQQFTLVSVIAEEIDGKIRTAREHLEAVARMTPREAASDSAAAQRFLDLQLDNRVLFDHGLFLASPRGEILARVAKEEAICTVECPLEGWLGKAASERRSIISDPFFWGGDETRPVILFAVPVFDREGGEVRAVLGGGLDLLGANFLGKLAEVRLGDAGYLYLYDRQRTLIVHPNRSRILKRDVPLGVNRLFDAALEGFEGTGETTTSWGLEALSSFKRLADTDWILAANFPIAEAYAPVQKAKIYFAVGLAGLLLLASVVVWFLMKRLTAPLLTLTEHVGRFGEEPVRLNLTVRDEIGTLARVFNRLLNRMADHRQNLEEQRRFSENLLQNAAAAGFVLDADHRVLVWNRACEKLTGIRAEDVLGTDSHWRAFYDRRRSCLADFAVAGKTDELSAFYADFRPSGLLPDGLEAEGWHTFNGRSRYIVFNAAPIRNGDGEIIAAIQTLEDITARKTAEENLEHSLSLLQATLESTADAILVLDLEGKIVSYNRHFPGIWPLSEEVLAAGNGRRALSSFLRQLKEPAVFSDRIRDLHVHIDEESRDTLILRDGRTFELFSRPQHLAGKVVGRVWSFRDITRQQQAFHQLRKLSQAVEQSPNAVVVTDIHGAIEYVNPRFTEITGYPAKEAIGQNPRILKGGDTPEEYYRTLWETITAGKEWRGEFRNRRKDGETFWENALVSPVKAADGTITNFIAVKEDITEKKLAAQQQMLTSQVLSLLALPNDRTDKIREILLLIRNYTGIESVGIRLRENGDFPFYQAVGFSDAFIRAEGRLRKGEEELGKCLCGNVLLGLNGSEGSRFTEKGSFWTGRLQGEGSPCSRGHCEGEGFRSMALIPLRAGEEIVGLLQLGDGAEGKVTPALVRFLESLAASIGIVFERRQTEERLVEKEERLHFMTNYDPVTGLPNRLLLMDRLRHVLAHAQRSGHKAAFLLVDLDRFKTVNDSLGHAVGDRILKEIAGRLSGFVREADTLARFGGDEFAIVLEELEDVKAAVPMAQKILQELARRIDSEGTPLFLTASVGISIYPTDAEEMESLVKFAEIAMYRAKESGRNSFQFFRPEMNARNNELLLLENSLHQAVEQEQFVLFYQPKVDLKTGAVTGVEALVRWRHPELGMVSPGDFIPLAEETGLIVPIGRWVLETACSQARDWVEKGRPPVSMAVNISGRQFNQPRFVEMVEGILAETGLNPDLLELEITESVLMENIEKTKRILADIKMLGIRLAIDDFGTGYSSLGYLKRFPIDTLKIDRSFIREVTTDANDRAITNAVIALADTMNLEVVAEGIETAEQLRFLQESGCRLGQGFLFSRPRPAEEVEDLLAWRYALPPEPEKEKETGRAALKEAGGVVKMLR
jgi:diguanylate cyclase (GGDEF)-like protein/PAS domain S-box-containing protein